MKMRERIARALCKRYDRQAREDGREGDGSALVAYNAGVGMAIKFWNKMADDAMAAMREPTEEMIEAGWLNAPTSFGHDASDREMIGQWQAMIDAARQS